MSFKPNFSRIHADELSSNKAPGKLILFAEWIRWDELKMTIEFKYKLAKLEFNSTVYNFL